MKTLTTIGENNMNPFNKSHQTVTVVHVSEKSDTNYKNRAARFVESLNQDGESPEGTIKSDVYSLNTDNGMISKGLNFPIESVNDIPSNEDLVAYATFAGYTQIAIIIPTKIN